MAAIIFIISRARCLGSLSSLSNAPPGPRHVAEIAPDAERCGDVLHRERQLLRRHVLQDLDVLVSLRSRLPGNGSRGLRRLGVQPATADQTSPTDGKGRANG